jgi:hypothetical protein
MSRSRRTLLHNKLALFYRIARLNICTLGVIMTAKGDNFRNHSALLPTKMDSARMYALRLGTGLQGPNIVSADFVVIDY